MQDLPEHCRLVTVIEATGNSGLAGRVEMGHRTIPLGIKTFGPNAGQSRLVSTLRIDAESKSVQRSSNDRWPANGGWI